MPETESFYRAILDELYDGVYFVDAQRRITYWNRGAERITGFTRDQVLGRRCADNLLEHIDDCGSRLCFSACPLVRVMADGAPGEAEVYLHHADGHRVPVLVRVAPMRDAQGQICGAVETFSDNSRLMLARQDLSLLATAAERDALTGLVNRKGFERRLLGAVAELGPGDGAGLLFIDVDHFKTVNDTYGHEVGDRVLTIVANTLSASVRADDCVGRWGGDEFVVLLRQVNAEQLAHIAEKLRCLAAESKLLVTGTPVKVCLSIGGTLLQPNDTPDAALQRADANLYHSKRSGRDRVSVA